MEDQAEWAGGARGPLVAAVACAASAMARCGTNPPVCAGRAAGVARVAATRSSGAAASTVALAGWRSATRELATTGTTVLACAARPLDAPWLAANASMAIPIMNDRVRRAPRQARRRRATTVICERYSPIGTRVHPGGPGRMDGTPLVCVPLNKEESCSASNSS
jgi:hypothetical protein